MPISAADTVLLAVLQPPHTGGVFLFTEHYMNMTMPLFLSLRALVKQGAIDRDKFVGDYNQGIAYFEKELEWSEEQLKDMKAFGDTLEQNL